MGRTSTRSADRRVTLAISAVIALALGGALLTGLDDGSPSWSRPVSSSTAADADAAQQPQWAREVIAPMRRPATASDQLLSIARFSRSAEGQDGPGEPNDLLVRDLARLLGTPQGASVFVVPYRMQDAGEGVCIAVEEVLHGEPSVVTGCKPLADFRRAGVMLVQDSTVGSRIVGVLPDGYGRDAAFGMDASTGGARIVVEENYFEVVDLPKRGEGSVDAHFRGDAGELVISVPLYLIGESVEAASQSS